MRNEKKNASINKKNEMKSRKLRPLGSDSRGVVQLLSVKQEQLHLTFADTHKG